MSKNQTKATANTKSTTNDPSTKAANNDPQDKFRTRNVTQLLSEHTNEVRLILVDITASKQERRDLTEKKNSLRTKLMRRMALVGLLLCDNMKDDAKGEAKQARTYRVNPKADPKVVKQYTAKK